MDKTETVRYIVEKIDYVEILCHSCKLDEIPLLTDAVQEIEKVISLCAGFEPASPPPGLGGVPKIRFFLSRMKEKVRPLSMYDFDDKTGMVLDGVGFAVAEVLAAFPTQGCALRV